MCATFFICLCEWVYLLGGLCHSFAPQFFFSLYSHLLFLLFAISCPLCASVYNVLFAFFFSGRFTMFSISIALVLPMLLCHMSSFSIRVLRYFLSTTHMQLSHSAPFSLPLPMYYGLACLDCASTLTYSTELFVLRFLLLVLFLCPLFDHNITVTIFWYPIGRYHTRDIIHTYTDTK